VLIDLHNHTSFSHDGFTSQREVIDICKKRGINAIAITEHDKTCKCDERLFSQEGIELIKGCEYTTNKGAHVIGLFISEIKSSNASKEAIISEIKDQDGLVLIPHPWKPHSGYFTKYEEDEALEGVDLIELINGGWNSKDYQERIINVAKKYNLKMVSSSDSHKSSQVGLCITKIKTKNPFLLGDARKILLSVEQKDMDFLIDERALSKKGRKTYSFQVSPVYQFLLKFVPKVLRRFLKIAYYNLATNGKTEDPIFTTYKI